MTMTLAKGTYDPPWCAPPKSRFGHSGQPSDGPRRRGARDLRAEANDRPSPVTRLELPPARVLRVPPWDCNEPSALPLWG